jgi:hypothetical protein
MTSTEIAIESIRRAWPGLMPLDESRDAVNLLVSKLEVTPAATVGELGSLIAELNKLNPSLEARPIFQLDRGTPRAYIEYRQI